MENSRTTILKAAASFYKFLKKQNNDKNTKTKKVKKILSGNDKKN